MKLSIYKDKYNVILLIMTGVTFAGILFLYHLSNERDRARHEKRTNDLFDDLRRDMAKLPSKEVAECQSDLTTLPESIPEP